eukprot:768287-Hanusia_phi.AAC.5
MIKSEMVASKAPRDLAVANKVLKTANALYQHAQRVQTSLRSAEILHQQTEYQQMPQRQQELVSKEAAVERLAANLKGEEQVADHLQELVKRRRGGGGGLTCRQQIEAKELFHKAAADVRSSNQEAREAKISLKAARTSEIEVMREMWFEGQLRLFCRMRGDYRQCSEHGGSRSSRWPRSTVRDTDDRRTRRANVRDTEHAIDPCNDTRKNKKECKPTIACSTSSSNLLARPIPVVASQLALLAFKLRLLVTQLLHTRLPLRLVSTRRMQRNVSSSP